MTSLLYYPEIQSCDDRIAISFHTCMRPFYMVSWQSCLTLWQSNLTIVFPFVLIWLYCLSDEIFHLTLIPFHSLPWRTLLPKIHAPNICCTSIKTYRKLTNYLLHLLKQKRTAPN